MDDDEMLASVTAGELLQFRVSQFPPAFITANPGLFLNLDWVHPVPLRAFLLNRDASTTRRSFVTVKQEPSGSIRPEPRVKTEDSGVQIIDLTSPPRPSRSSAARTCPIINNHPDIFEITSEDELAVEALLQPSGASSNPPDPSEPFTLSDSDSDAEPDVPAAVALSTTVWGDANFISRAIDGPATINRQSKVERVEYLNDIPSFLPVPRNKTAFVLDLRDAKFDFVDDGGELLRADTLILDKNQESWETSGSASDQVTTCALFNGEPVKCRRTRHKCRGCFRCSELDSSLVSVIRYELDPMSRADVISAEIATRMASGDTPEKLAAAFFRVITSEARKCKAKDAIGAPCQGHPIMKARINGAFRKGSFIACSEWTPTWRTHQSDSIPDNVNETLLAQLMSPQAAFSSGSNTEPCSRIISARVGLRQQFCAHIHLKNGKSIRGTMIRHFCSAYMSIYVPIDATMRMACVVLDHRKPHTHPMPALAKLTLDVEETYRKCVKAAGVLGTTVQKVDDAPTTLLLLKGQSPAMFHPSLHLKRRKQGIILDEKLIASPAGLGIGGVYARHVEDLKLSPESQYIHSVITTPDGHVLIITMVPYLANLVHVVRTVQVDTTFGRTVGDLNEWEFVIWYGSVERVLTVGRVYTDGADRPHYKYLFDELQRIIFRLTGKHLRFKRFTRGGNLITMGVDLEAAQVQGASDSFLPTNEPEYSGITTDDPDEFAMYYVRACISHAKRGVHGLKRYVTDDVFKRLMDFPYLKTEEDLAAFTAWIGTLKIKKVQDWWKHKLQYPWIRPSLIKTLSRIHPDDWDITDASTNLNEGQHHWTNQQTGVHLTILEAIETARRVDFKTAREVRDSLETGLLDNNSNNMLHRMGRNVQRKSNSLAKQRAVTEKNAETDELQADVDAQKAAKKVQDQKVKDAQSALSAAKGKSTRRKPSRSMTGNVPLLEASSSGRVLSPRRRARTASMSSAVSAGPHIDETPATVAIPELPFPELPPAPTPVDSTQPFIFTGDLAWLETFQFGSNVSQPPAPVGNVDIVAAAALDSLMLPDNSQFDADTEFTWFLANLAHGGGDFATTTPIPQYDFGTWDGRAPDYFAPHPSDGAGGSVFDGSYTGVGSITSDLPNLPLPPSSPAYPPSSSPDHPQTPIETLNADVDERNIVHSARTRNPPKRMLENLESSAVQTKTKKPKSRRLGDPLWALLSSRYLTFHSGGSQAHLPELATHPQTGKASTVDRRSSQTDCRSS
ncbi:hypothetical protein FB451DRAFT_1366387 [Mycena latifolia]|nr:hypothetical protein FB451DRAFT_1366387 [Mycena latifolia]